MLPARQGLLVASIVIGAVGLVLSSALEPTPDPIGAAVRVVPFVVAFALTAWVAWLPMGDRGHRRRTVVLVSVGAALVVAGVTLRLAAPEIRYGDAAITPGLAALGFGLVGSRVGPIRPRERPDPGDRSTLALVLAALAVVGLFPLAVPAIVIGTRTRSRLPEAHPARTNALVAVILGWAVLIPAALVIALAVVAALTFGL